MKSYAHCRMVIFPMTLMDPNPVFKVTALLKSNIPKRCSFGTKLLNNATKKPYTIYRMVPLSMTLSDLLHGFYCHDFLKSNIGKRRVLKTKLLLHNRKLYLTYGMILCLVTLT